MAGTIERTLEIANVHTGYELSRPAMAKGGQAPPCNSVAGDSIWRKRPYISSVIGP